MTDTPTLTFTDPDGHPVTDAEVRRLFAQQVPWAVRAMCRACNTPIPAFARQPGDPSSPTAPSGPAVPVQYALPLPVPGQTELALGD